MYFIFQWGSANEIWMGRGKREKRMEKGKKEGEEKKEGKFRLKLSGLELGGEILDFKKDPFFDQITLICYNCKIYKKVIILLYDEINLTFSNIF